jgi:uncharacterized protein (TIGR02453 family)
MATYFTPETTRFLRGLKKNNDREWFEARRDIYERAVRQPMLAFIEDINAKLESFAPDHIRPANKIAMRIYRDTRFSKNKLPYKTQIPAWWAHRGMVKGSCAGYYLHVNPNEVLVAAGVYLPDRDPLLRIRTWMVDNHVAYRKVLKRTLSITGFTAGNEGALTRMPKGFPADHPADDLLRQKSWEVSVSLPADLATSPQLLSEVVKRMKAAAPLVDVLNSAIRGEAEERDRTIRRPMF